MASSVRRHANELEASALFRGLARLGFAINGGLHLVIGAIAINVALGGRHQEVDQSGALQQVASTPGGIIELWVAVIGLGALGLWELIRVFVATGGTGRKKWMARLKAAGRAVAYSALCGTVLSFTVGASRSSAQTSRSASAALLAAPGGVIVLCAIGLVVLGVGGWFVVMGIAGRFLTEIRVPKGGLGTAVIVVGRVGYLAKGIALAIVGVVVVVGALTADPRQASGLDGGLKALAGLPFGQLLLALVAVGLMVYGVYCILRARLQKL